MGKKGEGRGGGGGRSLKGRVEKILVGERGQFLRRGKGGKDLSGEGGEEGGKT